MSNKRNAKRPNRPPEGQPWVWFTAELMASAAWRSMSINARRALDRIIIEHMAHGGTENGELPVTHKQFVEAGVTKCKIGDALDELGYLRLIRMERGRGGAQSGISNKFTLTWLPLKGSRHCDDVWKSVTEEHVGRWQQSQRKAKRIQRAARNPAEQSKERIQKPRPTSIPSQTYKSVCGTSNVTNFHPNPRPTSRSTYNILQGDLGQSPPTAQAKGTPTCENIHTRLAEEFGGGATGWGVITALSPATLESLEQKYLAGSIEDIDRTNARLEASQSNQTASQQ